jgi:hypothetical protein
VRNATVSLALVLTACSTTPDPWRDEAAIEEQIAEFMRKRPDDAEVMATLSPDRLLREGRTLTIRTGAKTYRFTNAGYCEGYMTCTRYRADQLLHERYIGIQMVHGEYPNSYLIIDLKGGRRLFDTGERPLPAPSAPLAAVADDGEANSPIIGGLAVVDLERRRVLWHKPDWYIDARIEAWENDRCVRASFVPSVEHNIRTTVWIARAGNKWIANETRPATCETSDTRSSARRCPRGAACSP